MSRRSHGLLPLRQGRPPSDPDLAMGARLLSHATPMPRSEARKRRVWNLLSVRSSGSRLGFRLSALHVAFASVLFAAVASATAGHYYVEHRAQQSAAQVTPPADPPPQRARSARRPHAKSAATEALPVSEPALTSEPAVAAESTPTPRALARAKQESIVRSRASDADAQLLVEAMRARSAGDAKRVSQLVAEYRTKHPQGVLQEEALILSIESAVARKATNAGALAREYLSHYPSGRFAAQARRALATEAP